MSLHFSCLKSTRADYRVVLGVLVGLVVLGYGAAHQMEVHGHHITGMNNQVVWGLPHVFALGLILAASGALNVASMSSVFGLELYHPLARLSALLAIALLSGGLLILVLDLGRPERLVVAMTHYNFKSVFAWNIFLYTGFVALVVVYLWTMFERRVNGYTRPVGVVSLLWRFVLTSGSGAIFGFLVARPAYDAAILVPLFILLSLSIGTATFLLVAAVLSRWHAEGSDDGAGNGAGDAADYVVFRRLAKLLALFVSAVMFLTMVFHLTNLYAAEHHPVERFILLEGGVYTWLFWLGQVGIGGVVPLVLLFAPGFRARRWRLTAAGLVVLGGFAQLYVIIIGGQAFPVDIFPGKSVASSFYDGEIGAYSPSLPEFLLGFGGVAVALLGVVLALRVLPFMPNPGGLRASVAGKK